MNQPRRSARFAVGSRDGPRSTIWKVWTYGDEAYLATRMFGSDSKVSFHASGQCQWSCTDTWVTRQPGRRNADRHIVRWSMCRPNSSQSELLFRIQIPVSEIRPQSPLDSKTKVFWVNGFPPGATAQFLLYMTRPSTSDPVTPGALPSQHLFSLQLASCRWLVASVEEISLSPVDLSAARAGVIEQVRQTDSEYVPREEHRFALFSEANIGAPHGLIELCATET